MVGREVAHGSSMATSVTSGWAVAAVGTFRRGSAGLLTVAAIPPRTRTSMSVFVWFWPQFNKRKKIWNPRPVRTKSNGLGFPKLEQKTLE